MLADHSEDIQLFDVQPPNELRGIEAKEGVAGSSRLAWAENRGKQALIRAVALGAPALITT